MSANVSSIIRWAGSKRKLLSVLIKEMPISFDRYVEPFCGSASLYFKAPTKYGLLSDINGELINAWENIKRDSYIRNDLIVLPKTKEFYYEIRSRDPERLTDRERAVRFLYLNRYCFNGVYRTNRKGLYNVPRGSRTGDFPSQEAFNLVSKKLSTCELVACDYKTSLTRLKPDDFVYIDPPYTSASKFTGEYGVDSFSYQEMPQLIRSLEMIDEMGGKFLLSYVANEDVVSALKEHFIVKHLSVARHVQGFKTTWGSSEEILVKNYE